MEWFLNMIGIIHAAFLKSPDLHCFILGTLSYLFFYMRFKKHEKDIIAAKFGDGFEPSMSFFRRSFYGKFIELSFDFIINTLSFDLILCRISDDWIWFVTLFSWVVFVNSFSWFANDIARCKYDSNIAFTIFILSFYTSTICFSGGIYFRLFSVIQFMLSLFRHVLIYREFSKHQTWKKCKHEEKIKKQE